MRFVLMNTTTLDQAEMLCIVTPEKAINYQWANVTKNAKLESICIAALENIPDSFIFTESNGRSVTPKENVTYIRDPFDSNKFFVADSEAARQIELLRFNHYKRVAHLLGLKRFELKRVETEKKTTDTKVNSKGGLEIDADLKTANLDAESFFESEEYDPISGMTKDKYSEVYQQAEKYAKDHQLYYASDVQNLLRAREPGAGMLRKRTTKYTYLSKYESSLNQSIKLDPLKGVLKIPSPAEMLIPKGLDLERTKKIIKTQIVSLEMEFYNYEM